jgi:hypothetical protein
MLWTCNICGRTFSRTNQNHSCNIHSFDDLFSEWRKQWLLLYLELKEKSIDKLGEFEQYCPMKGIVM